MQQDCQHARQKQEKPKHLGNELGGERSSSLLLRCTGSLGKLQPRLQCLALLSEAIMPRLAMQQLTSHHITSH